MPPRKKERLSPQAIQAIRQWIQNGAIWDETALAAPQINQPLPVPTPQTDSHIAQLNQTGAKAEYNAWGHHSIRVDLSYTDPQQLPYALNTLRKLSPSLAWLDNSHQEITTTLINILTNSPNLERLHLDHTNITDQQLNQLLPKLPKLQYLNLYNTQISDATIPALSQATELKKLYISRTNITPKSIQKLNNAHPHLQIIHQTIK